MRLDKIILRAALSTLAAIAILCVAMLLALCFIFPATMMELTYNMGMDDASIRYATRAYDRSGDAYFIAYGMEVAIETDNDAEIESCGTALINDDEFADYCAQRDNALGYEGYAQYVCGKVCVAMYAQGKRAQAVERASEYVGEAFPENNAFAALLLTAMSNGDTQTADMMSEKMNEMSSVILSEADQAYFDAISRTLETWRNG